MSITDDDRKMIDTYYSQEYGRQAITKMTDDWDERVVQAVVTWFEIKMNEALQLQDKVNNVFSLTDSIRLLMQEAPGVEAFFMKSGAEEFLRDEVEIIIGYETDEEMKARLKTTNNLFDVMSGEAALRSGKSGPII